MSDSRKSMIRQIFEGAPGNSINLALGEPVFNKPEWFLELLNRDVIRRFDYSPNAGYPEAREAVKLIGEYPGEINRLCLTCGAEEGLFAALSGVKLSRGAGKTILAPSPYFLTYPTIAGLLSMEFRTYPLPEWTGISVFDAVKERIDAHTAAVIVNTPGNPAGNVIGQDELRRLERLCEERDVYLIVDEVYRFFGNEELPVTHNWESAGGRTAIINSVTKSLGLPGLRLGWVHTDEELMGNIIAAHQSIAAIAPGVSQQLIAEFPEHPWADWIAENRLLTLQKRKSMMELLDRAGISYKPVDGSIYIMIRLPKEVADLADDVSSAFHLRDRFSILLVPGSAFGREGKDHMRISIGGDPDDFKEAVLRIRNGFNDIIERKGVK